VRGSAAQAAGNAQYAYNKGVIEISRQSINSTSLTAQEARDLASNVYHEGRHAEQWFLMARQEAAQGMNAAQINSSMGVPQTFANAAEANPLAAGANAKQNLAGACQQSVCGANTPGNAFNNAGYRNGVINDMNNGVPGAWDKHRHLSEEEDAWATGGALPCGSP
jgi:hypothetical protein